MKELAIIFLIMGKIGFFLFAILLLKELLATWKDHPLIVKIAIITTFLLFVGMSLSSASPNSYRPNEATLAKIEVKEQQPHNPADFQQPSDSFDTPEKAEEYQKTNGGMVVKVLGKWKVIGIKKGAQNEKTN